MEAADDARIVEDQELEPSEEAHEDKEIDELDVFFSSEIPDYQKSLANLENKVKAFEEQRQLTLEEIPRVSSSEDLSSDSWEDIAMDAPSSSTAASAANALELAHVRAKFSAAQAQITRLQRRLATQSRKHRQDLQEVQEALNMDANK